MNRRRLLQGLAAIGVSSAITYLKPSDDGAPYNAYFAALNQELKNNGPMRPSFLIDLDRLDHNIDLVTQSALKNNKAFRIVEKSLSSQKLLAYIMQRAKTARLMSFHQPFMNDDAQAFPHADLLVGKPLPVRSAELFYKQLKGSFDPSRQLQWLIDSPEHLKQYLELAQGLRTKMRINIEIDVGLHRGGVKSIETLTAILDLISANPQHLEFSGFMGYDPHIGMNPPKIFGTQHALLDEVMQVYQNFVDHARHHAPQLWHQNLTLNTAGSPTYRLHERETISNEISVGTALLKPTHYDLPTLSEHIPAAYIATPVLKSLGLIEIPLLNKKSKIFSWWNPNQRETYCIYGGNWNAEYESPQGLKANTLFGPSSNQEVINGSTATQLKVDDQVFLRPAVSESVITQFGDLIAIRGNKIQAYWPVMQ